MPAQHDATGGKANSNQEERLTELYRAMFMAREIDTLEDEYVKRGEAFFTVAGAGHEAAAALNEHLIEADYLHLHYRDKALMLARGILPEMFFHSLFCKDASASHGRQMSAHLSDRRLHVVGLTGPVGNHALQAVGIAADIRESPERPVVICSMGDGTSQQGEVLEAIAEAVRWQLPVLFLVEDNHLAISTQTRGKTFFDHPGGAASSYYGLPIHRLDGRDAIACRAGFGSIVAGIRETRGPAIVHLAVKRLASHSNADNDALYRDAQEIDDARSLADPLGKLRETLLAMGTDLVALEEEVRTTARAAVRQSLAGAEPQPVFSAKCPLPDSIPCAGEYIGNNLEPRLTMLGAIQGVLRERLRCDPRTSLYGQDIEDPKGDVFGITRGLSSEFPGRVLNAPLSESTIVGTAIGRALAGGRPVAFLQFADFMPLAFNQIAAELGSMYWRSGGTWTCPVVIMIACGGYRPGLGPFHAQSLESLAVHIPGIDVFMPSTAGDAAGLLNTAFESGRPTLFFYPKNCLNLNTPATTTSPDVDRQRVAPGRARFLQQGEDITLVAYGNTVGICADVADTLLKVAVTTDLIDLRSLSPWDEAAVLASAEKTGKLLVVHEDNASCGFAAEVLASIFEKASRPVKARRVVRADTYVPCHFGNQLEVLPSFRRVLTEAASLLGLALAWSPGPAPEPGIFQVMAGGTAPSDRSVMILEWHVKAGDAVTEGQDLACLEGSKSAFDLASPAAGIVEALLVEVDACIEVGTPIARIRLAEDAPGAVTAPAWLPVFTSLPAPLSRQAAAAETAGNGATVAGITAVAAALGSRCIENTEILRDHWGKNESDIARMTGIHVRRRIAPGEDVVSLGVLATRRVLAQANLNITDIGLVICATGTSDLLSPSVACRILDMLTDTGHDCPAYDISAACAGYLYGLTAAWDHVRSNPAERVLLITSEIISSLLDPDDFTTAILFGDAATATIVSGEMHRAEYRLGLRRPLIFTSPEPGKSLRAPHANSGDFLFMDGMKVFEMGVRCMTVAVRKACADAALEVSDLDLLVPHQANKRIIDTICNQLRLPRERVYLNLASLGNTSSSSIPICLSELLATDRPAGAIGITAFGAGFTYGACVLDTPPSDPK